MRSKTIQKNTAGPMFNVPLFSMIQLGSRRLIDVHSIRYDLRSSLDVFLFFHVRMHYLYIKNMTSMTGTV